MKRLAVLASLMASLGFAQEFKLGSKVAGFTVQDLHGAAVPFSELRGAVTVVVFTSTTCPVSNAYNGRMNTLYRDYRTKGVKFIFLNANQNESAADVATHAKAVGFDFPVYKDAHNNVADRFDAQVTPETYVIDSSSMLVYHGQIDDSRNEKRVQLQALRMALDAVLSGKPVPVTETKAFGCSIKRARTTLNTVNESGFQKLVAAHQGQVVLYDFWATWCAGCREEMPKLIALDTRLRPRGFELITISADEPEQHADAEKVLREFHAPQPAYRKQAVKDEQFINAVDPKWSGALPALFLYDRDGRKVQSFVGETDPATIEAAVVKLL